MSIVGILALVVALLLSVMLHEAGHFFTARRYGMKATQFFVGFGPTIFSRTKGETEYGVKAIPAGGFVKIIGMTPLEEVEPGDEDRAFYKQPAGRKTVVLAAGSTVHFLICLVLVFLVTATYGTLKEKPPVLSGISTCVADSTKVDCAKLTAADNAKPGPALKAGLKSGDIITAVDGKQIRVGKDLTSAIQAAPDKALILTVKRGKERLTLTVTPAPVRRPKSTKVTGAIGVLLQARSGTEHYGVVGTFKETGSTISLLVTSTVDTFTKKLGTITKVYSKDRDPAGFIGVYGAADVSGQIASAKVPLSDRIASIVLIIASLNLFVGVFNLLPLLPLDGGHIAVVFYEQLRHRIRQLRGYVGEVQRVDFNKLMPVTLAVVLLFAGFTLWILGADIVNPITLN